MSVLSPALPRNEITRVGERERLTLFASANQRVQEFRESTTAELQGVVERIRVSG